MSGKGIDYGMGQTNVNLETGIRYGIIPMNSGIMQAWCDDSEPDYGDPCCPKCGNTVTDNDDRCKADYYCVPCKTSYYSHECFGEEPNGQTYAGDGYEAFSDSSGDVWVVRSPYYTRAQFCSPCAPGACYLENPVEDGEKAYCFGPDWFDSDSPCPYPVWSVADDTLVYSPEPARSGMEG